MKRWVMAPFVGLLLAFAVVLGGPRETVQCSEAGWPNSWLGDTFGHVDGATFTGCEVPSGGT